MLSPDPAGLVQCHGLVVHKSKQPDVIERLDLFNQCVRPPGAVMLIILTRMDPPCLQGL